jgi:hypothetical protein
MTGSGSWQNIIEFLARVLEKTDSAASTWTYSWMTLLHFQNQGICGDSRGALLL